MREATKGENHHKEQCKNIPTILDLKLHQLHPERYKWFIVRWEL